MIPTCVGLVFSGGICRDVPDFKEGGVEGRGGGAV